MKNSLRVLLVLIFSCVLTLSGCDTAKDLLGGDDDGNAARALASVELAQMEAALSVVFSQNVDMTMTAEQVAEAKATEAATIFTPAGCAEAIATGPTVGYNFTDCSGPLGLVGLKGQVGATFGMPTTGFTVNLLSTGLTANGVVMTMDSQSVMTEDADKNRELVMTTGGGGTLDDGTVIARVGKYTIAAGTDNSCLEITTGTWTTTTTISESGAEPESYVTNVTDYKVCGGDGCPESGGNLTYTGTGDQPTTTIQFDGSAKPLFTTTDNLTPSTLEMSCVAN